MHLAAFIRGIVPQWMLALYHRALAHLAALVYRFPSRRMITIGVTGTNGKSTTCYLIAKILEAAGFTVGLTSTIHIKIGPDERLNTTKMTMQGRFALQRLLRRMRAAGCTYAVIETSSQGIAQFRHAGIEYDVLVFTNLTPEHIEAHGNFENYKHAKGELFEHLKKTIKKCTRGEGGDMRIFPKRDVEGCEPKPKTIVLNGGDAHGPFFNSFWAEEKIIYGIEPMSARAEMQNSRHLLATNVALRPEGSTFNVGGERFALVLPGVFNVENALAAIAVGAAQGVEFSTMRDALSGVKDVPGRVEYIREGQTFSVIVDYAPEPASLGRLYEYIALLPTTRLIHVLGSAGGGRDRARRPILGEMAARHAHTVIVTNEDPYDEDPMGITHQVATGARSVGKEDGKNLFVIPNRTAAIAHAIAMAQDGDTVLFTGKGAEQAICVAHGKKVPWDERAMVRSALRERLAAEAALSAQPYAADATTQTT